MEAAWIPMGWYRDPAARHEQRYWDGTGWTSHVADGGVAGEDSATLYPAPPTAFIPLAPTAWTGPWPAGATPGVGVRGVGVATWRAAVIGLACVALLLAAVVEVVLSVLAVGTGTGNGEGWLWLTCWLYEPANFTFAGSSVTIHEVHGYPPLALWIALVVAFVFLARVSIASVTALKDAGARPARLWSSGEEKQLWSTSYSRFRSYRRSLFRTHYRVLLAVGGIGSLVVVLVSALAIAGEGGMDSTGTYVSNLSVGLGPWVCLVAGIVAVACALAACPWSGDHRLLLHADGSVDGLS